VRRGSTHWLAATAALALSVGATSPLTGPAIGLVTVAHANDTTKADAQNRQAQHDETPEDIWAWRETWSGSERVGRALSVFSGSTMAIGGGTLNDSGWRIRSVSGHGRSTYPGVMWIGGHAYPVTVHALTGFSDLLAGYQWGETTRFGRLTVKAFAGGSMTYQRALPHNSVAERGLKYGGKAALETWLDLNDRAWLSVDTNLGTAHRTFNVRSRFGWRIIPGLSIGPEAGVAGDSSGGSGRAGGFARLEWGAGDWWSGELSTAGGITTNTVTNDVVRSAPLGAVSRGDPYANVNLLLRY
jgi:Cellulose biosynthesis protein BcsS